MFPPCSAEDFPCFATFLPVIRGFHKFLCSHPKVGINTGWSSFIATVPRPGLALRPVDQHSSIVWPKNLNHKLPSFVLLLLSSFLPSSSSSDRTAVASPRVRICKWKIQQCATLVLVRNSIASKAEKLQYLVIIGTGTTKTTTLRTNPADNHRKLDHANYTGVYSNLINIY